MPTKEKEFAYITGFSSNVYKTISAAEARISTTSTRRSYISAMLLALKSLLFFCLDIFDPAGHGVGIWLFSFQSNATKFPHPRLHIAVSIPRQNPRKAQ